MTADDEIELELFGDADAPRCTDGVCEVPVSAGHDIVLETDSPAPSSSAASESR